MPLSKEEASREQITVSATIKTLPHFFNQKKLQLRRNGEASDALHDVKEFSHTSGSWMVKDINANGRERYDDLSPKIKSLLLQAEMMHSELFNYISGINGPHYRIIIDEQQNVVGLASEKVIKTDDFIDWLQKADLTNKENQQTLHQYFQLLTSQMMIEDPDPNPYNIMVCPKGLVKIDEGWASYQLLLSLMKRPTPFEHDVKDIDDVKSIGHKALSTSMGNFPIGGLLKKFLPKFLQALGYWYVQRTIITEACKPFFAMDFKTLHAWILNQQSDDSTLLETLIAPTLVYHFVTEKCARFLKVSELKSIQVKCHQLIEKGIRELIDLVNQSLKAWYEKALVKTGLVSVPTARGLESAAFSKILFEFTDALLHATESQLCEARQQVAKQYDLTLQFQTMRYIEIGVCLTPWMKTLSTSFLMNYASQLSRDYYLTATHYLLTDSLLIERAALLSRMQPEKIELFTDYHYQRQQQYRKQLKRDPHYLAYFIKHAKEIKQALIKRVETFNENNPFYEDLDLQARFETQFDKWQQHLVGKSLFSNKVIEYVFSP